jgi:hypothetical protein
LVCAAWPRASLSNQIIHKTGTKANQSTCVTLRNVYSIKSEFLEFETEKNIQEIECILYIWEWLMHKHIPQALIAQRYPTFAIYLGAWSAKGYAGYNRCI